MESTKIKENTVKLVSRFMNMAKKSEIDYSIVLNYVLKFLFGVILSRCVLPGGIAPLGVAFSAAVLGRKGGLAGYIGSIIGSLMVVREANGLKYVAVLFLICAAEILFHNTSARKNRLFMPTVATALNTLCSVPFIDSRITLLWFLAEILLVFVFAYIYIIIFESKTKVFKAINEKNAQRLLLVCFALFILSLFWGLFNVRIGSVLNLGLIVANAFIILSGYYLGVSGGGISAIILGAFSLAGTGNLSIFPVLSIAGLLNTLFAKNKYLSFILYMFISISLSVFLSDTPLPMIFEAFFGGLLFLLLTLFDEKIRHIISVYASKFGGRDKVKEYAYTKLSGAGEAINQLVKSVPTVKDEVEEDPSLIFTRTVSKICKACPISSFCWVDEYETSKDALNNCTKKMLESHDLSYKDLPAYFADRCINLTQFVETAGSELGAYFQRKQLNQEMAKNRTSIISQYRQMSELLYELAEDISIEEPNLTKQSAKIDVEAACLSKDKNLHSGDNFKYKYLKNGDFCIILSDGMGSGEKASEDSIKTIELIEKFLESGISLNSALININTALKIKGEMDGIYSTLDLCYFDFKKSIASFYKLGAAPSYVKTEKSFRKIVSSSLPCGLEDLNQGEISTELPISDGDIFVFMTDGGSFDDEKVKKALMRSHERSLQGTVDKLLWDLSKKGDERDDFTIICLRVNFK